VKTSVRDLREENGVSPRKSFADWKRDTRMEFTNATNNDAEGEGRVGRKRKQRDVFSERFQGPGITKELLQEGT